MVNALQTSLSGLLAASTKVSVATKNIANSQSTGTFKDGVSLDEPYQPQQVLQSTAVDGSVITQIQVVDNPTVPVYQPDSSLADTEGVVDYPNVDIAAELVKLKIASFEYKANATAIREEKERMDTVLDILG